MTAIRLLRPVILSFQTIHLHAQWLETSIQLPPQTSARDLIYNPISNKIYTANKPQTGAPSPESVTIIDGNTNGIITTLQMPAGSRDFCHNTVNNRIYVAGSVSEIDGTSNNVIKTML